MSLSAAVRRAAARWAHGQAGCARLPVLMYHKVQPGPGDPWTVTVDQLDRQWACLNAAGYQPITCGELARHLDQRAALPARPVLITFDDGYANNREYACPLLERHGLRATIFLPVRFIGGTNGWDDGNLPLMSYDELASLSARRVELGLHSFAHGNYRRMSLAEIAADLDRCLAGLQSQGIAFTRALAYPYGGLPRGWFKRRAFRELLARLKIACGLRVGNRVNRLPLTDRYAITRLDIRADDTLDTFCRKLDG